MKMNSSSLGNFKCTETTTTTSI